MCYAGLAHKAAPQNHCTLQNALAEKAAEKAAWWAAMCYAGLVPKSLLKVKV